MSAHKSVLRNILDAMIESRSRQANREVAQYRELFDATNPAVKSR